MKLLYRWRRWMRLRNMIIGYIYQMLNSLGSIPGGRCESHLWWTRRDPQGSRTRVLLWGIYFPCCCCCCFCYCTDSHGKVWWCWNGGISGELAVVADGVPRPIREVPRPLLLPAQSECYLIFVLFLLCFSCSMQLLLGWSHWLFGHVGFLKWL